MLRAIAGAARLLFFQGTVDAACNASQINGRWVAYSGFGGWLECEWTVRNNRNYTGRCRFGGDPVESMNWVPVRGTMTVNRTCAVNGRDLSGEVIRGTMQANGQLIAGLLIDPGPGPIINRPALSFTAVKR
jgi:hypothetical protein